MISETVLFTAKLICAVYAVGVPLRLAEAWGRHWLLPVWQSLLP
jgi:hypothetical protein